MIGMQLRYFFHGIKHYRNGFAPEPILGAHMRNAVSDIREIRQELFNGKQRKYQTGSTDRSGGH